MLSLISISSLAFITTSRIVLITETEGKNQALVEVIPFCGEHPGSWFEDTFRSANEMDGISKAGRGKMAAS